MTEVREKARAQQATGQARGVAGKARNRLSAEVDQRSSQAGDGLHSTAGDARSVAEELRRQGKDKPAQLAERAAEHVDRVGGYLQGSDGEQILRDVEAFGRRNSGAVAAGGLVFGFAASRFLKASSSRRYQASAGAGSAPPPPATPAAV